MNNKSLLREFLTDFNDDSFYILTNINNVCERLEAFVVPALVEKKQVIIFTPHISHINREIKRLRAMKLLVEKYYCNTENDERERILNEFREGSVQFLYATPRMYMEKRNKEFKPFVHEMIKLGNLSCIVFNDAKAFLRYQNDTTNYEGYDKFVELKDFCPSQKWVIIGEDFLHTEDSKLIHRITTGLHIYKFKLITMENNRVMYCQTDKSGENFIQFACDDSENNLNSDSVDGIGDETEDETKMHLE
uniref:CSON000386 protein n=1 Tax=Culicoides sonorensis TaxID=179676 RepID=A0A336MK42_CULSO